MKGLKLYEDIFNDSEMSKLSDFVSEIHAAGQNGELSGILMFYYFYLKIIVRFSVVWTITS